jgi:hypothetical protein
VTCDTDVADLSTTYYLGHLTLSAGNAAGMTIIAPHVPPPLDPIGPPIELLDPIAPDNPGGGAPMFPLWTAGSSIVMNGAGGSDILVGSELDDELYGKAGDDVLDGGGGNDVLYGGTGSDIAEYSGSMFSYEVWTNNGVIQVSDREMWTGASTDSLIGVETLRFGDGETWSLTAPIVLDLDGDGTELLAASETNAAFDMDGDGKLDDTSWFGSGDAILFLDRDGNGTVTNAGEFSFTQDSADARSDLDGLKAFDSNGDGKLTAADARFGDFRLWQDRNGDGVAAASEITTLTVSKVAGIDLAGTPTSLTLAPGSAAPLNIGSFTRADGTSGQLAAAVFGYFSGSAAARTLPIPMSQRTMAKKMDKYQLVADGGEIFVSLRKAKGAVDAASGKIGPATILNFGDKALGMLAPIVLDLDGDGVELRSRKDSKARFDMDGDGSLDDTGWIGKGDGFLVIDRNGDGLITTASELSFLTEKPDARSDLEALAALDSNRDRKIDSTDLRFGELKVWVDSNRNGITDSGELKGLRELGIASISLAASANKQTVKPGQNLLVATGSFTMADGTVRTLGDAALAFTPSGGGRAAAQVESNGEDSRLVGLGAALRAGLAESKGSLRDLALQAPLGVDPFELFGTPQSAPPADTNVQHTQNLPKEALPAADAGAAELVDRRLALITQDLAAFGGVGRETERIEGRGEIHRLDYFA